MKTLRTSLRAFVENPDDRFYGGAAPLSLLWLSHRFRMFFNNVPGRPAGRRGAFSLVELLFLLAILAILAGLLFPALAKSKVKAKGIACLNNQRQLMLAWRMYAEDNQSRLVGNYHGAVTMGPNPTPQNWVAGWLDWTLRADNTNSLFLTDPSQAKLASYVGRSPAVFKCPADDYLSPPQKEASWKQRVRSSAMNACMGEGNDKDFQGYQAYRKLTDIGEQARRWVLIDEHPDSLNDGCFFVDLAESKWIDLPAAYHAGACGFGFADGHAEIHKWLNIGRAASEVLYQPFQARGYPPRGMGTVDYQWLRDRTSAAK